jgi:hypothetical protein
MNLILGLVIDYIMKIRITESQYRLLESEWGAYKHSKNQKFIDSIVRRLVNETDIIRGYVQYPFHELDITGSWGIERLPVKHIDYINNDIIIKYFKEYVSEKYLINDEDLIQRIKFGFNNGMRLKYRNGQ